MLEIFEIPFGNWLVDHFVGPMAEGLHDGQVIGRAHRVRHLGAPGPHPPVPITLQWNAGNIWMVVRIGGYQRTICSPIFCFGLLYPTLVDAHNMADNHSNNLRIGWNKEDDGGGLCFKVMGDCQRSRNGFDSLVRFAKNNPDIFGAKEVLELALVAKVVPVERRDHF